MKSTRSKTTGELEGVKWSPSDNEATGLAKYDFHDQSIIAVDHAGAEIRIAIESAEVRPEGFTNSPALMGSGTIKGILRISGIRTFEVDGKKFKGQFEMRADSATILEFDVNKSKVHFFIEWVHYPESDIYEGYTDFIVEAGTISWQDDPGIFDPDHLTLIEERFVVPLIILAVPSIKEELADPLITAFRAINELSHYVVKSFKRDKLEEFPRIFNLVERLHNEGEESVKEAATIGFLEGIQCLSSNAEPVIAPEVFVPYLGTESKRWWDALNDFWNGKKTSVSL